MKTTFAIIVAATVAGLLVLLTLPLAWIGNQDAAPTADVDTARVSVRKMLERESLQANVQSPSQSNALDQDGKTELGFASDTGSSDDVDVAFDPFAVDDFAEIMPPVVTPWIVTSPPPSSTGTPGESTVVLESGDLDEEDLFAGAETANADGQTAAVQTEVPESVTRQPAPVQPVVDRALLPPPRDRSAAMQLRQQIALEEARQRTARITAIRWSTSRTLRPIWSPEFLDFDR